MFNELMKRRERGREREIEEDKAIECFEALPSETHFCLIKLRFIVLLCTTTHFYTILKIFMKFRLKAQHLCFRIKVYAQHLVELNVKMTLRVKLRAVAHCEFEAI